MIVNYLIFRQYKYDILCEVIVIEWTVMSAYVCFRGVVVADCCFGTSLGGTHEKPGHVHTDHRQIDKTILLKETLFIAHS